jgi:hypothetical protein
VVLATGEVSTLAGIPGNFGNARLNSPTAVTVLRTGELTLIDQYWGVVGF